MLSKFTTALLYSIFLIGYSNLASARIEYHSDNSSRPVPIVEARGTCDHNQATPFPGEKWSVLKLAGETSYVGPGESGRSFIDKPITSWEAALCRQSQRSVKTLLHE